MAVLERMNWLLPIPVSMCHSSTRGDGDSRGHCPSFEFHFRTGASR